MNILFLNPINLYKRWPIPNDFTRFAFNPPAVSFPQLSACLPERHKYELVDGIVRKVTIKELEKRLKDKNVVGISCCHGGASLNTELNIKLIKKIKPNIKIVLGGMHATAYAKEWVERGADFIVEGEGEVTFKELIDALELKGNLRAVKGISFRLNGYYVSNPGRDLIKDLDTLPMPKWDLLNFNDYGNRPSEKFTATIETSRGCNFKCDFCPIHNYWGQTQRFKSTARIIDELLLLKKLGIKKVLFGDDTFGNNYYRDKRLVEEMLRLNLGIRWFCFSRADSILKHKNFYKLAVKAGLECILVGFESMNDRSLSLHNKYNGHPLSLEDYKEVFKFLKNNDIFTIGLFIVGYPGELIKDAKFTLTNYSQICNFPLFSPFRPEKSANAYSLFKKESNEESFYYDAHIKFAEFEKFKGIWKKSVLVSFFRPLFKIFSKHMFTRHFFLNLYRYLFAEIADFNYNKLKDVFFLVFGVSNSLDCKSYKHNIVDRYLNKKFIFKLKK